MKQYDTICPKCGGLIAKPGVIYGWGGTFCQCPDEIQLPTIEHQTIINVFIDKKGRLKKKTKKSV